MELADQGKRPAPHRSPQSSWNGRLLCRLSGIINPKAEGAPRRKAPADVQSLAALVDPPRDGRAQGLHLDWDPAPGASMDVERIFHAEESGRRFIARMGEARQLTACYEAGPTGY